MTNDDLLYRHRLLVFARAAEEGVSRACRALGYHRSWFYRWKGRVEREGLEVLRPRERRAPRMPNQIPPWQEKQILALALANPGLGPRRLAAQLAVEQTLTVSASGVLRVLRRHGLETRLRRLSLVSGYAAPPQPERPLPPVNRHLEARQPGDLVQLDCFHIGRLTGTKGRVWQYTAIDVASSFVWAQVHRTHLNPSAQFTTALARRVAKELSAAGWKLKAITTDNGSEFRSLDFREAVGALGLEQRFIRAGRPQTNGAVERVQRTILEECWRPTFAMSLVPKYTTLRRDLAAYLRYYNFHRAHTGQRSTGRPPAELVYGSRKVLPR
ncbi:MAG: transposase [Chloroflexi bacterium]|nr:MAG: transposase [Chloroflexota bacterium]TMD03262.1 MAG: transposase [Chloroflexota bacterium]